MDIFAFVTALAGSALPVMFGVLIALNATLPILTDMGSKGELPFSVSDIILRRLLRRLAIQFLAIIVIASIICVLTTSPFITRPLAALFT